MNPFYKKFYLPLLVISLFCFANVVFADIVCVKKQVKPNKKGVVNLKQSVKVAKSKCKKGYTLLYNIPKGEKGDKGETGAVGPKGEKGATGPKGDTGNCSSCNSNIPYELPSGTTITGQGGSGAFFIPAPIPITGNDVLVNYKEFKHPECQGSVDNPTAAPGKVCVYATSITNYYLYNSCGDPSCYELRFNNSPFKKHETAIDYKKDECVENGYRWQEAGCRSIPGWFTYENNSCYNNTQEGCLRDVEIPSYYWDKYLNNCFTSGWYMYFPTKILNNDRYWDGSKCLTKLPYKETNRQEEVFQVEYEGFISMNENLCSGEGIGYADIPYWDGSKCYTSLSRNELLLRSGTNGIPSSLSEEVCNGINDNNISSLLVRNDLQEIDCTGVSHFCQFHTNGTCYKGSKYGFSTPFYVGDGATWAYTAP